MSDSPETLSAILAEMREVAKSTELFNGEEVGEPLIRGTKVEDWADRIEAAYKREHAEWHAETDAAKEARNRIACKMRYEFAAKCRACKAAPGNAAAIRDALNRVEHLANDLRNITERDTEVRADVNEIVDVCRAALAAPARNCDRFQTAAEAALAFNADTKTKIGEEISPRLLAWLFARAEGGAE